MAKVSFEDKVDVKVSVIPRKNKVIADDLNEIKASVNQNVDDIEDHVTDLDNPHEVTKSQVGLGDVDNTSDEDKPISTATATALSGKQDTLVSGTNIKTVKGASLLGAGDVPIDENATHTGEVTGATVLTVNATAISNKAAIVGVLAGTEEVLVNDGGLKKVTAQQLRDLKPTSFTYEISFNEVLDVLQRFTVATNITAISAYNVASLNYSLNDAADVTVTLPFAGTISLAANDRIVWKITYTTGTLAVLNLTAVEL